MSDEELKSNYGVNPLGNGKFQLIPSLKEIDRETYLRYKALTQKPIKNDILGMSWSELEKKQGGKLKF